MARVLHGDADVFLNASSADIVYLNDATFIDSITRCRIGKHYETLSY